MTTGIGSQRKSEHSFSNKKTFDEQISPYFEEKKNPLYEYISHLDISASKYAPDFRYSE